VIGDRELADQRIVHVLHFVLVLVLGFHSFRRANDSWALAIAAGFAKYSLAMTFRIELERETDGRWIAEIPELPGVMAYGCAQEEALARVKALALRVLADRGDHVSSALS
jgi:predicted RNase H-like HicB family nuclease